MPSSNFLWEKLIPEEAKDAAPDYKTRPFLDKAQLALGMYARSTPGGVASDKVKKLMKYHGVHGLNRRKIRKLLLSNEMEGISLCELRIKPSALCQKSTHLGRRGRKGVENAGKVEGWKDIM